MYDTTAQAHAEQLWKHQCTCLTVNMDLMSMDVVFSQIMTDLYSSVSLGFFFSLNDWLSWWACCQSILCNRQALCSCLEQLAFQRRLISCVLTFYFTLFKDVSWIKNHGSLRFNASCPTACSIPRRLIYFLTTEPQNLALITFSLPFSHSKVTPVASRMILRASRDLRFMSFSPVFALISTPYP